MPHPPLILARLSLGAALLWLGAPAAAQPTPPPPRLTISTRLILPPHVPPAAVTIAAIAVDANSTRELTQGRPVLDTDGTFSVSYDDPGRAAQVLLRFTYPDAPGAPNRLWLAAPEPAQPNLRLPTGPAPTAPGHASIPFRPSAHGFRFVNHFGASPLSTSLAGTFGVKIDAFGLCGGMSFAAADLFLANRPPPDASDPPPAGSPLYGYIYRRQSDSLGALAIQGLRFARWMSLPRGTISGTNKRTYDELPAIRAALDAGAPAALGLDYISSHDHRAVWQNHQVLALGYTAPGDGSITITIYDPNYPGRDDVTIRGAPTVAGMIDDPRSPGATADIPGLECREFVGDHDLRPVRGLFVMPYSPATPPDDLSSIAPVAGAHPE